MIVGCIITFNDMPLVRECVESMVDKVDKLIIVDGRYRDFPGDSWDSTDGTLEYICSIDKADVISTLGYSELDKRNRYLEELNDGDIVLNLDSDEVLVGEIPKLEADFGIIRLHDGHSKHIQDRATRFFKYREGMRYENVHYTLYRQGKMVNNLKKVINPEFSFENIEGCHIEHNWHKREDLRKHYKSLYYKKLVQMEAGYSR